MNRGKARPNSVTLDRRAGSWDRAVGSWACARLFVVVVLVLVSIVASASSADAKEDPKLVLLVIVDQMRGDLLASFESRFGSGGFRRILSGGRHYAHARFEHAATFTAAGHAAVVTGADAAGHGLPGNDWLDRETGEIVYCIEDPEHRIVGSPSTGVGVSPRLLDCTTIADELIRSSERASRLSRAFAVSIKDRGAVIPAGHRGKAFWYDRSSGRFVSSSYHYPSGLPKWAVRWNAMQHADRYRGVSWKLLRERETYIAGNADDRPWEAPRSGLGRTFPHTLDADGASDTTFYARLPVTPFGDRLTLDFTLALLEAERIGKGVATDFLSVSFSATDYIGHEFGPDSLEYEDQILRLDACIADLLARIDETVGLDETLVVLTADHGVASAPEYLVAQGVASRRVGPADYKEALESFLRVRFGADEPLVGPLRNVNLYLDPDAIRRASLDAADVERAAAAFLEHFPGIEAAFARADLLAGRGPQSRLRERVERSFHPKRSGNVVLVQRPDVFLYHRTDAHAAMHGSPYAYDAHVPLVFRGPGIRPGVSYETVDVARIAPTIAASVGIPAPSRCRVEPLPAFETD